MKRFFLLSTLLLLVMGGAVVIGQKKELSPKEERREQREKRRAQRLAEYEKMIDSLVLSRNFQFNPSSMQRQPAAMLFSNHIDSLAAAGAVLADVWLDNVTMPVVDCLGDEFLNYVKDGMTITVQEDGTVVVE